MTIWLSAGLYCLLGSAPQPAAAEPTIDWYSLRSPGPAGHDIEQGSGLCFGSIGKRDGLWIVCDRNGGQSAGRIYRIGPQTLVAARRGEALTADEEFVITPPREGWPAFRAAHPNLGDMATNAEVLDHLQQRVEAGLRGTDGPRLDLEAVTIGPGVGSPAESHLFVVAEEPYSLVLELAIADPEPIAGADMPNGPSQARLVATYRYIEVEQDRGADSNDGLEGIAYAGSPGRFWWVEEGTRLHKPDAHPRLFFAEPRLGLARLLPGGSIQIDEISDRATHAVRSQRVGDAQTLNALCRTRDGQLLAVDRNGGWIVQVDPKSVTATRWLNLYDLFGQNLRELLASFPGPRRMPYVSIEGLAVDGNADLWLLDDPAMPEAFRASCLVRISGVYPPPTTDSRPQ